MGFDSLFGNARLKENLRSAINKGHISHFYVISGPAGSGKHTLARLLAAAILCREADKPCCRCNACRKVLSGTHPDFITIDDPEKKTVSVDLVRDARTDIYIRPNEAEHKIYLFPRAQDMGIPAQNALLKVLEEPPSYGVFLLLTDNPEKLLPTVRSRCTALTLDPLQPSVLLQALQTRFPDAEQEALHSAIARSGGYLGQAISLMEAGAALPPQTEKFFTAYCAHDAVGLLDVLTSMEKWKREQLIPLLEQWVTILAGGLSAHSGIATATPLAKALVASRDPQSLMHAITVLKKSIEYAQGNVSIAAICGALVWALR